MLDDSVFSELEKYQTDHLVLLIGGNPLPNAVAGLLLAKKDGSLSLVHSGEKGTQDIAERLHDWFLSKRENYYKDISMPEIDVDSPRKIFDDIQTILQYLQEENVRSVGLHYTSGTKDMSIHAYRALEAYQNQFDEIVFSYLNPRTMRIQVHTIGTDTKQYPVFTQEQSVYVASVKGLITIDDMGTLHEGTGLFVTDNPSLNHPILKDTARAIATHYQNNEGKLWKEFKNRFTQQVFTVKDETGCNLHNQCTVTHQYRNLNFLENKRRVDGVQKNWIDDIADKTLDFSMLPPEIKETLRRELGITSEIDELHVRKAFEYLQSHQNPERIDPNLNDPEFLMDFLKDTWLEHYVAHCFLQLGGDLSLDELRIGLTAIQLIDEDKGSTDQSNVKFEFEVDVVGTRGYQLFMASCTTKGKGKTNDLKQKLFEAYRRARDIGGDEARTLLVCTAPQATRDKLREVIRTTLPSHVQVFGKDDLIDLETKIKEWVQEQIGDSSS